MKPKVILFSTTYCSTCKTVEKWLPGLCKKNGYDYAEVDCIKEPQVANFAQVENVPVLDIYDKTGAKTCRFYPQQISPQNVEEKLCQS